MISISMNGKNIRKERKPQSCGNRDVGQVCPFRGFKFSNFRIFVVLWRDQKPRNSANLGRELEGDELILCNETKDIFSDLSVLVMRWKVQSDWKCSSVLAMSWLRSLDSAIRHLNFFIFEVGNEGNSHETRPRGFYSSLYLTIIFIGADSSEHIWP